MLSKFLLFAVKAISVSMIYDILNKSSFKFYLSSSSFCFLFETLTCKNVLTLLIEMFSAELSALLMKISMCENCLVPLVCDEFELIMINLYIMLLFDKNASKLTAVNLNSSLLFKLTDLSL